MAGPPWSVSWPAGRVRTMLMLVVLAVALELAAGTGLAYVAGFSAVRTVAAVGFGGFLAHGGGKLGPGRS